MPLSTDPPTNIRVMILPVHARLRDHLTQVIATLYSLEPIDTAFARAGLPAEPRSRGSRDAGRVRAGSPTPQGAAGDRAGGGRAHSGHSREFDRSRPHRTGTSISFSSGRHFSSTGSPGRPLRAVAPARRSSSTRPSTRTRLLTSGICGMRRSATRSSASCASAGSRSKCRTTSTIPVCRSPTWSWGSACSRTCRWRTYRRIADSTRFDYYCWDLYARVTDWYGQDKARLEVRAQTLHDIEHGGNENADIAAFVADRIVRCHLGTMARMNVDYDLLTWEGDILRLKFWAQAFEVLKAKGAVYLRTEGRLAGCWVMPIQEDLDAIPNSPKANSQTANSQSDEAQSSEETAAEAMTKARSARRSSSGPTASSRMSARTSRTSSGSSGCSVVTSSIASSRNAPNGPLWATCSDERRTRPSAVTAGLRTSTT